MRLETRSEWLDYAREHAAKLGVLISNYHPVRLASLVSNTPQFRGKITAHGAEQACAIVREKIAGEQQDHGNPVKRFETALKNDDVWEILSLLNSAWFGVPETTECWGMEGFIEAVNLIEDPPEPTEEELARWEKEAL